MILHDHLRRATASGVRAFAAITTGLTEEASRRVNTSRATTHPYGGTPYAATLAVGAPAASLVVTELNYNPYELSAADSTAPRKMDRRRTGSSSRWAA